MDGAYETIEDLLEYDGFNDVCFKCEHYQEWQESHPAPFGIGSVSETMAECDCEDDGLCPRLDP